MSGGGAMMSGELNRNEFRLLSEIQELDLGKGDKPDYFSTRATVIQIKPDPILYAACPVQGCNKKVTQMDDLWRCDKCNKSHDAPNYRYVCITCRLTTGAINEKPKRVLNRYLMQLCVSDHTGQLWLSAFDEVGQQLMGITAAEVQRLKDDENMQGSTRFTQAVAKASCKMWNFSCRAKQETYNVSILHHSLRL